MYFPDDVWNIILEYACVPHNFEFTPDYPFHSCDWLGDNITMVKRKCTKCGEEKPQRYFQVQTLNYCGPLAQNQTRVPAYEVPLYLPEVAEGDEELLIGVHSIYENVEDIPEELVGCHEYEDDEDADREEDPYYPYWDDYSSFEETRLEYFAEQHANYS